MSATETLDASTRSWGIDWESGTTLARFVGSAVLLACLVGGGAIVSDQLVRQILSLDNRFAALAAQISLSGVVVAVFCRVLARSYFPAGTLRDFNLWRITGAASDRDIRYQSLWTSIVVCLVILIIGFWIGEIEPGTNDLATVMSALVGLQMLLQMAPLFLSPIFGGRRPIEFPEVRPEDEKFVRSRECRRLGMMAFYLVSFVLLLAGGLTLYKNL